MNYFVFQNSTETFKKGVTDLITDNEINLFSCKEGDSKTNTANVSKLNELISKNEIPHYVIIEGETDEFFKEIEHDFSEHFDFSLISIAGSDKVLKFIVGVSFEVRSRNTLEDYMIMVSSKVSEFKPFSGAILNALMNGDTTINLESIE